MFAGLILDILGLIVTTFSSIYGVLTAEVINGFSIIEIMFGAGIVAFIGWVVVKWIVPT